MKEYSNTFFNKVIYLISLIIITISCNQGHNEPDDGKTIIKLYKNSGELILKVPDVLDTIKTSIHFSDYPGDDAYLTYLINKKDMHYILDTTAEWRPELNQSPEMYFVVKHYYNRCCNENETFKLSATDPDILAENQKSLNSNSIILLKEIKNNVAIIGYEVPRHDSLKAFIGIKAFTYFDSCFLLFEFIQTGYQNKEMYDDVLKGIEQIELKGI